VRKKRVNKQRFFHLAFDEYVGIQGRTCQQKEGPTKDYRSTAQIWTDIAQKMALSAETYQLAPIFYQHKKRGDLDQIIKVPIPLSPDEETSPLVQFLVNHDLLYRSGDDSGSPAYFFASKEAAQFLGTGDWLEVYVWHQTNLARFADDCRWGYSLVKEEHHSQTSNGGKHKLYLELDLAVMYHAQLVIAECKSVEKPFEIDKPFRGQSGYLRDIDAVAHVLGRTYVGKVFITNQPGKGQSYEIFKRHAHDRNIIVVTREELPKVGEILKEAAMKPRYPRK